MLVGADKKAKHSRSGRLLYIIWKVWNRRIFQGVRLTYLEVAHIAHEGIHLWALTFRVVTPVVAPND
jgi:hypothetical protein